LFGVCSSFASSSYGLCCLFRNRKCSSFTHPILERDQKEYEGDIPL
jgi:hypothetical protein